MTTNHSPQLLHHYTRSLQRASDKHDLPQLTGVPAIRFTWPSTENLLCCFSKFGPYKWRYFTRVILITRMRFNTRPVIAIAARAFKTLYGFYGSTASACSRHWKNIVRFLHIESRNQWNVCLRILWWVIHGKSLLTPNRNPTHNRHYLVDILVLTIG